LSASRKSWSASPVAEQGLSVLQRGAALLSRVVSKCVTRIRVEGLENVPGSGPLIVVANHMSNADPPLVHGYLTPALGRPMHILAKESLFVGPIGVFLRSQGITPVKAGGSDIEAYRTASAVLDAGNVLTVFPEGTRSHTGRLGQPKPGVAMLATRTRAPILPVGISGTDRFLGRGSRFPKIGARIVIRVGEPFSVDLDKSKSRRAAMDAVTDRIMREIATLTEARHRGRYGGPDTV
jgi:1-acyl-sn-glycerol-3-phosphate acyltransferase